MIICRIKKGKLDALSLSTDAPVVRQHSRQECSCGPAARKGAARLAGAPLSPSRKEAGDDRNPDNTVLNRLVTLAGKFGSLRIGFPG